MGLALCGREGVEVDEGLTCSPPVAALVMTAPP